MLIDGCVATCPAVIPRHARHPLPDLVRYLCWHEPAHCPASAIPFVTYPSSGCLWLTCANPSLPCHQHACSHVRRHSHVCCLWLCVVQVPCCGGRVMRTTCQLQMGCSPLLCAMSLTIMWAGTT